MKHIMENIRNYMFGCVPISPPSVPLLGRVPSLMEAIIGLGGSKLRLLGQILPHLNFCNSCCTKNGFPFLNYQRKYQNDYILYLENDRNPRFHCVVFLSHNHPLRLCDRCLWLLSLCSSGPQTSNKGHMGCKSRVTSLWSILFILLPPGVPLKKGF